MEEAGLGVEKIAALQVGGWRGHFAMMNGTERCCCCVLIAVSICTRRGGVTRKHTTVNSVIKGCKKRLPGKVVEGLKLEAKTV
jgi:hypothetical protein